MMKYIYSLLIILALCLPTSSLADIHAASDATRAAVASAIAAATYGDTVTVPAGTETWNSSIKAEKCIVIEGAGVGVTNITNGTTTVLFYIDHDSTSLAADCEYRITGFSFDGDDLPSGKGILVKQLTLTSTPPKNVRIDNNYFENYYSMAIAYEGQVYGLIDNNEFVNNNKAVDFQGRYRYSWYREQSAQNSLGTDNYPYFEDNTIGYTSHHHYFSATGASGHGGRWVIRFNDIEVNTTYGWLIGQDAHGNNGQDLTAIELTCPGETFTYCTNNTDGCCTAGNSGVQVMEFYNNSFDLNASDQSWKIMDQRGGTMMDFNNTVIHDSGTRTGYTMVREEDGPADDDLCTGSSFPTDWETCLDPVRDTYIFNNKNTFNDSEMSVVEEDDPPQNEAVEPDYNYWVYESSFDGSTGIGVGTLANIPGTCTTNVGYWATDQGTWNTTGDDGVFYRCTSTDTWTSYYEPLTYPHPLIGGVPLSVSISTPTSIPTHDTSVLTMALGGGSEYASTISSVAWANSEASTAGTCTGTTSWTCEAQTLVSGSNAITATVTASDATTATDLITVTYTPPPQPEGYHTTYKGSSFTGVTMK